MRHLTIAILIAFAVCTAPLRVPPEEPFDPNPATSYCDQLVYTPYAVLPPAGCV